MSLDIRTHHGIDRALSGVPVALGDGSATVELATTSTMAADAQELVHGGFVFSLADHAAMLAINEPTVVLGAAETRFLAPTRVGETLVAEARVAAIDGKKHHVDVTVRSGETTVCTGRFTCFVPSRHVLDRS
ncbi:MAG: PaaI family thioesterase [Acidobacteriota bacterium]